MPVVDTARQKHKPSASTTTAQVDTPSPSHRRRPSRGPSASGSNRLGSSQASTDDGVGPGAERSLRGSSYNLNSANNHLTTVSERGRPSHAGSQMSLSREPSPLRGGGWSSPGLTTDATFDGRASPRKPYADSNGVTWATAKARSEAVNTGFSTRGQGFFSRHARKISESLPSMLGGSRSNSNFRGRRRTYSDKEKLGRGSWPPARGGFLGRLKTYAGSIGRRMRMRLLMVLVLVIGFVLFWATPLHRVYRRAGFLGGGSKFVIVLAANYGGGVMDWKGPREWAIERDSVRNKKRYAKKWGYDLEIVDMSIKKRYAHEWRESWEKVDTMRNCMRKYPKAEWFWWLDLNTFIMEPSVSLQQQVFNDINAHTYRDINEWNPLNLSHPFVDPNLDAVSLSPTGDNQTSSIDMLIPQDCSGFNLGSFFLRRSTWTDRLLDVWWDPVHYEQKHMEWEHKEQDALEHLYTSQPWIRSHVAFIEQRRINSFPEGACGENGRSDRYHYSEEDRDFLVNMAGCEWGRDCWGEMYNFRELSNKLNRGGWDRFKDVFYNWWHKKEREEAAQKEREEEERKKKEEGEHHDN